MILCNKTLYSVTGSCHSDFRDVKFHVKILRNLKVKKSVAEFLRTRSMYLGLFKLASTYYLKQKTFNRILHPKGKGNFHHFKLLLRLFTCKFKVSASDCH